MSNEAVIDALLGRGAPRIYLITVNVQGMNVPAFNQYLLDSKEIEAFWNYIPLVYCVKTRLSANALGAKLDAFIPSRNYLVAEINPRNIDGKLPNAAWEWFYVNSQPPTAIPAAPLPSPPPTNIIPPAKRNT